jgi:hypothetical protein
MISNMAENILDETLSIVKFKFQIMEYIMTCILIARQRLGKHIPSRANACKKRTSIARQRISKDTSLTIEVVFSVLSVQSGYKEV